MMARIFFACFATVVFAVSAAFAAETTLGADAQLQWMVRRPGPLAVNIAGKREGFELDAAASDAPKRIYRRPQNREQFVAVTVTPRGNGIDVGYETSPGLAIDSVRVLEDAMLITADEKGYILVPCREGLLIPADSGVAFTRGFGTYDYEGCHMAMIGLVRNGEATLVTWDDPYIAAEIKSVLPDPAKGINQQTLTTSIIMRKSAKSIRITSLGKGDWLTIAKAYREIAKEKGLLVTWDQKLKENPHRAAFFGASNYKLWSCLSRRMNPESTKELSSRVNWTFDEVGQIAEHLKNDLKLDDVHFIIGGWIRRGYDNQHPDILPAAPECGGNEGLAAAAKRVRACGYIFDLHDNYQDMYKDSPSWDEQYLQKTPDGKPARGGAWAGGTAWLTCSQKALELAKRPQNLEAVKKLTDADCYFIDTTYAAGLQECFDPKHPLTKIDDLKWKSALSDYARSVFGMFGSECGREWAIPHADYFEGLTGVSGTYYHSLKPAEMGATVVPLFEMVYRDCIAMYGKYGYDINRAGAYVIHHVSIGRTLNYHSVPSHIYWKNIPPSSSPGFYVQSRDGWTAGMHPMDCFVKNTHEILSPLNKITAQMQMSGYEFLTADRLVRRSVFGEGAAAVETIVNGRREDFVARTAAAVEVVLPSDGFVVSSLTYVAFCAKSFNGLKYDTASLFTIRSLDGKPIAESARVRVFHGFGDPRVKIGNTEHRVEKETILQK